MYMKEKAFISSKDPSKLRAPASLNVDVHAEDADVEDHRNESAHADAVGERPHVLDGELAHVGAADGAEEGAEDVDDDGEGQVEDEEERRPVVAVEVGQDCVVHRVGTGLDSIPSFDNGNHCY